MESTRGESRPVRTGVVRGCRVETTPIRSLLRILHTPRVAWASPTTTVAAGGATATLTVSGENRFERLQNDAERLFEDLQTPGSLPVGARPRLFGGFAFTSPRGEAVADGPWQQYPDSQFVLPAVQLSVSSDGTWLTTAAVGPDAERKATARLDRWRKRIESLPELDAASPPKLRSRRHTPGLEAWRRQVESVVQRIRRGNLEKVVLAQSLSVSLESEPDVVDILTRLGGSYPSCHRFLFEAADDCAFIGATPERLVRLRGRTVDTEALAGSIGRGDTREEDDWLDTQLRESKKNAHEHSLVVDAIRQQLEGVTGDVETGNRTVRKLSNVQHLQTPIRATLAEDRHVLELVERLHPTPAVGGLPPASARRTIRELEGFDRGWYAAPVGWVDANGDGTFVVGIRSAVTTGKTATLFAGAGIVSDSNPDHEWDELQLKFRPILDEFDR